MNDAIAKLEEAINNFILYFGDSPAKTTHPFSAH